VVGFQFCGRPSFIAGTAAVTAPTNSTDGDFANGRRRRYLPVPIDVGFRSYDGILRDTFFFFVFN
jgi:hypothetical protein